MDPCPFVLLIVESLSLKPLPSPTKPPPLSGIHPSTTPCFCKICIPSLPSHTALLPLSSTSNAPSTITSTPAFHLDSAKPLTLSISVYTGPMSRSCGVRSTKLLGRVILSVSLPSSLSSLNTFYNGWLKLNHETNDKPSHLLHVLVRSELDPRFVFHFSGKPECSPVIFQIQENIKQPVFSCKFSADRNYKSQSLSSNFKNDNLSKWRRSLRVDREQSGQLTERKGWMIVIHDLSGSPVAAASMITPFVPSPGSNRGSRSNAGAWVILHPIGGSTVTSCSWKSWGRLEAWRERGPIDGLGYKVELFSDNGPVNAVPIAEGKMSVKKGGKFCIDSTILGSKWLPNLMKGSLWVQLWVVKGK